MISSHGFFVLHFSGSSTELTVSDATLVASASDAALVDISGSAIIDGHCVSVRGTITRDTLCGVGQATAQ